MRDANGLGRQERVPKGTYHDKHVWPMRGACGERYVWLLIGCKSP
jgi:hypothetical protein